LRGRMTRIIFILFLISIFFAVMQKAVAGERSPYFCLEKTADRMNDSGEQIQEEWKALLRELEKLQKEAEKDMRQDVLPYLRKEVERLRKLLRDFERKEEKREPNRTWT
jgi:hypothetical protein